MCRFSALSSVLVVVGTLVVPDKSSGEIVVAYRMLIDGVHSERHLLEAGTHTLSIEVFVSGNDLGEYDVGNPGDPQHYYGGVFRYAIGLDDREDQFEFKEKYGGFPPGPMNRWDSTAAVGFSVHGPGVLRHLWHDYDVNNELGHVGYDDFDLYFNTYGGGTDTNPPAWTEVVRGDFEWTGTPAELVLFGWGPYHQDTLVFGPELELVEPDRVLGDSTTLVPEASASLLLGSGLVALLLWRVGKQAVRVLSRGKIRVPRVAWWFTVLVVAGMMAASSRARGEIVVAHRMVIDGVHGERHVLEPGTHTLSIEVLVSGNDLGEFDLGNPGDPQHYYGGCVLYSVNLDDMQGQIEFEERIGGLPPAPMGIWDSTAAAGFTTHMAGRLNSRGHDVAAETGAVNPDEFSAYFNTYGGGSDTEPPVWTEVVRGDFHWTGVPTDLILEGYSRDATLVFGPSLWVERPDEQMGDATLLVPEPSTLALFGIGAISLVAYAWRRRRRMA